jgi:molybdopterin molybdotransferase
MIAVEEALERILRRFEPLPEEWVQLSAAHGRVLARDVRATRSQPPQAVSAMDGYAVRARDLASGRARLRVIGEAPAGRSFLGEVAPGETVRIFTGGALPVGTDAVALQENARRDGASVEIEGRIESGAYVRPAGLDFHENEIVLPQDRRLSARDLGLAASVNRAWLPVRRRPRIALLATGDELVMPGEPLGPDQIVSSNAVALGAMIEAWGGVASDLGIVRDEAEELGRVAADLAGVDLVVTLGGASVGERDLVRGVLGQHGLELDFWKIAMRPGKPLLFGAMRGVPLLGLPGNPVSAGVCAVLFVRAVICRLLSLDPQPPEVLGALGRALGPNDQRQEYLRAEARWRNDGRLEVLPAERQDSSMLSIFARADCLIRRAPFAPAMAPGTSVPVLLLGPAPVGV